MPEGQYVSFGVYANEKLPEYTIRNKFYTEVNLHGPTSFIIEEDDQKYPVVPFTVCVERKCEEVVWMKLFLDGQLIISRPLVSQKMFEVNGVKIGNEIRQMLFSLPKIYENQEKKNPLGVYAGTIRLEVVAAQYIGQKAAPEFRTDSALGSSHPGSKLYHLTKKDVGQCKRDAVGNIVSREGKTTLYVTQTGKFRTMMKYTQTSRTLEEIILYYRPRIHSHTPKNSDDPLIKEEKEKQRVPLSDVGNSRQQPTPVKTCFEDGHKVDGLAEPSTQSSSELANSIGNMGIKCGEDTTTESCTVEDVAAKESKILALAQVQERKFETKFVPANPSVLISPKPVKKPDIELMMSDVELMSDIELMPDTGMKPDTELMKVEEKEEIKPHTVGYVLVEEDDESEGDIICTYEEEDDSIVCMENGEELEEDSVICMGDDDCYVLDVSNHVSVLEIDDTLIDQ